MEGVTGKGGEEGVKNGKGGKGKSGWKRGGESNDRSVLANKKL